jgi:hypothetical protein
MVMSVTVGATWQVWEAREIEHRMEMAKLRMQQVLYRQALLDAGLDPPDRDGADLLEMWVKCREVIVAASECLAMLGTSKELLDDWG